MGSLKRLADQERELVLRCVRAAVEGPFFPDWEFHSLMGVTRTEARGVLDAWPPGTEGQAEVQLTINNALNNLLRYPHGQKAAWSQLIGAEPTEVRRVFDKWSGPDGPPE